MEIENKKFRCHFSIIIEQCGKAITSVLILAFLNLGDLFTEDFDVSSDGWIAALVIVGVLAAVLLIVLIFGALRWRKTTITIEEDALIWERNTINKKKLTIALKNISSINIERNVFERIIGTAKIKLDTESLSTADTTDVMFIFKYDEAVQYKTYLEEKVRVLNGETEEAVEALSDSEMNAEHEQTELQKKVEYVASEKDIVMHCVYDLSIFLVLLGVGMAFYTVYEIKDVIRNGLDNLQNLILSGTVVITLGYTVLNSIFGKFIRFYKLTVSRTGNRLYLKYGLFKIKEYIIPIEKINAIHINQTMIGKICKRYNVSMECVGVGDEENETAQLTLSLKYEEILERLKYLLPEYNTDQILELQPVSKKVWYHKIMRLFYLTFFVICFVIGVNVGVAESGGLKDIELPFVYGAAVAIVLIYVWIIVRILIQFKVEGICFGKFHMFISTGTFGRDIMIVPYKKIQYASVKNSPISKKSGLVRGEVHILAGALSTTKEIPFIEEAQVEVLKEKLLNV